MIISLSHIIIPYIISSWKWRAALLLTGCVIMMMVVALLMVGNADVNVYVCAS